MLSLIPVRRDLQMTMYLMMFLDVVCKDMQEFHPEGRVFVILLILNIRGVTQRSCNLFCNNNKMTLPLFATKGVKSLKSADCQSLSAIHLCMSIV